MSQDVTVTDLIYSPLGSDPDVSELVELFVSNMPQRIGQLERLFAAQDWAELRRLAHQFKGAAGSYGFPQLSPFLCQLEGLAEAEDEAGEIERVLEDIRQTCRCARAGTPFPTPLAARDPSQGA